MKDLLRDQGKETGKEMKLKSSQVIFFLRAFQYNSLAKKTEYRYETPITIEKDFRFRECLVIFCNKRLLFCLTGPH